MGDLPLYFGLTFWVWVGLAVFVNGVLNLQKKFTGWEPSWAVFIGIVMVAVIAAGYQMWAEKQAELVETQSLLNAAHQENATLKGQLQARGESALQKELEATKAQVAALQRFAPRRLSQEDRTSMTKALSKTGRFPVRIAWTSQDLEAIGYAEDFESMFKDAGWPITQRMGMTFPQPVRGLQIIVRDKKNVPDGARVLAQILHPLNVEVVGDELIRVEAGEFIFMIGSKPQ